MADNIERRITRLEARAPDQTERVSEIVIEIVDASGQPCKDIEPFVFRVSHEKRTDQVSPLLSRS